MGNIWCKCKSTVRVNDSSGKPKTYYAGDWIKLKGMTMRHLLTTGQVEVPGHNPDGTIKLFDMSDCGVVITGGNFEKAKALATGSFSGLEVIEGFDLVYPRTLLWNAEEPLRVDLMPVGFHRLTTGWQIAAPLWKYQKLAADIGSPEERKITKEIIKDLRVPVYETGCVYVRRCPDTLRFMEAWKQERKRGPTDKLSFQRALYRTKPVIAAQPITWMNGVRA